MLANFNNKAFTLIELLVVVAIIGILAAVGVTAFSGFQKSAKKKVCIANHNLLKKNILANYQLCQIESSIILRTWKSHGGGNVTVSCPANMNTTGYRTAIDFTNAAQSPYEPNSHQGYPIVFNSGIPTANDEGRTFCHAISSNSYRIRTRCDGQLFEDMIKE